MANLQSHALDQDEARTVAFEEIIGRRPHTNARYGLTIVLSSHPTIGADGTTTWGLRVTAQSTGWIVSSGHDIFGTTANLRYG